MATDFGATHIVFVETRTAHNHCNNVFVINGAKIGIINVWNNLLTSDFIHTLSAGEGKLASHSSTFHELWRS
jgi:hypothetical protein